MQAFTPENLEFQEKVLLRSGLGEETYLPECESWEGVGGGGLVLVHVCMHACVWLVGQQTYLPEHERRRRGRGWAGQ